jgi:hypothetical protein
LAELRVEGGELVLHLSAAEKAEGVHGDLRVPLSAVRGVEILDNAHAPADHGIKIGTRLPGVIEVGTVIADGHKIFAAVHRDTPMGLRVLIDGASYDQWIVGCADPQAVAASLGLPGATRL